MAEQSDNNSANKKPPLFPPNFVTLVQLKERWDREQERKQREKEEEQEKQQQQQRREDEKKLKLVVGEGESGSRRVKGEPINRRKRPIRQSTPRNQGRKPEVLKLAIESAVTDAESQGLKDIKKKKSGKRKNKKKGKIEDKAGAEIEEVIRGGENEEVIKGEEEAPSCQNVEKEIVPRRRGWWPRVPRTDFRPTIPNTSRNEVVEIEKKFVDLSVDGGNRRDHRYSRQKGYPNRRNSVLGRDNWGTRRPCEGNGTNAGKMWVKKGEVGDGNVVEIQSSSPIPKGLK
ncbi:hypothetical protein SLEP1_g21756 [Rubroshorea leprosula]|uniref:Uncharacterized protein n=1 Tax=Rubroshorea leprosula TaxID=152421 RepID=A0AAV5JD49_9ROSI|nr:hypothetical protein SLEP1_g21756 [Rubroshorea leprosula]